MTSWSSLIGRFSLSRHSVQRGQFDCGFTWHNMESFSELNDWRSFNSPPRLLFLWHSYRKSEIKTVWLSFCRPNMERFSEPGDSYTFDSPTWQKFLWNFHQESELKTAWLWSQLNKYWVLQRVRQLKKLWSTAKAMISVRILSRKWN